MKKNIGIAGLLLVLLVLLGAGFFYFQSPRGKVTRISLVGESQTKVAPDTAVLTFSVVTQNKEAVAAQQENAKKTEAVIKAIEALNTESKPEIKTQSFSLDPEENYRYNKMPSIIGYSARNSVTVSTKALDQTGAFIDAATKAGANSVDGIAFIVREDSPVRGDAIGIATRQAMAKAEAIAQSLGGNIVRIVEMREGGAADIPEYPEAHSSNAAANVAYKRSYTTPVRAGSLDVHSQITLVVEIQAKT